MSYTTQAEMIERFGEDELIDASDRDRSGAIDAAVLSRAISDAEAQIDLHLRGRYQLPVADSTGVISRIAADLARYYLWGISVPEMVAERHKAAMAALRDLARGVTTLEAPAANDTAGRRAPAVVAQDQVMTADNLGRIGL